MAQDTTKELPKNTWTLLTDSDVAKITFQNTGRDEIYIKGTTSVSTPTSTAGALLYSHRVGELNVLLTDLFPGLTAPVRVYALSASRIGRVAVQHA